MRVGKLAIETQGWFEKMCAFTYHRLERVIFGKLL